MSVTKKYQFRTRISSEGVIHVPDNPSLYNQEADIIILPRSQAGTGDTKASGFVKKWAGFLKNVELEDSKYDYLMEKHE